MSLWRVSFLAERYGRMTMTLEEVAEQIGMAPGTIRNRRTAGEFGWLRLDGRQLCADVADVAAYLEQRRTAHAESRSAPTDTPRAPYPSDAQSQPSGRRRRTRVPEGAT